MKNLRRNIIFSGMGYIIPILVFLVTTPIILSILGADDYGLYVICLSLIGFMVFMDLGIGQAVIKYVAEYEATGKNEKIQPVLDMALVIYLILGLGIASLLFGLSPWLGEMLMDTTDAQRQSLATSVLQITALAFAISYVNQFFLNLFKAYHRFDIPSVIHNTANVSGILLATVLLLMGHSLVVVLWGHVLMQVLAISSSYLMFKSLLVGSIRLGLAIDKSILREMLSFSAYAFVSNFLGAVVSRLDKLLLGIVLGTEFVTYYQIPHTVAQMGNGVVNMVSQVIFPRFSELSGTGENAERLSLYRKANIVVFCVSLCINMALIVGGQAFLELWMSAEIAEKSTLTLQIIAAYFFFQSNTVVAYWALHGAGNAKITALSSFAGTLVYLIGFFVLTSYYSYNGAALSLFLLLTPLPFFYLWIERHIGHRLSDYLLLTLVFIIIGAVVVFLVLQLNILISHPLITLFIDGVIITGIFLLMFLFIKKRYL